MCNSFVSYQSSLSYQLLGMSCCFHVQNSKLLKLPGLLVTRVLKMCNSFASYQSSLSYQLLGMSCCFHVQNSKLLKLPGLLVTRVLNMCNSCVGYQGSLSYQLLGIFFCFHVQNNEVTWITSYQGHQNMQDFRGLPKFLKLPITGAPLLLTFKAHHES